MKVAKEDNAIKYLSNQKRKASKKCPHMIEVDK